MTTGDSREQHCLREHLGHKARLTYALWERKPQRREDHEEEHEKIQRGDQGPRNLAYDEAKQSNGQEDDIESHCRRAPGSR